MLMMLRVELVMRETFALGNGFTVNHRCSRSNVRLVEGFMIISRLFKCLSLNVMKAASFVLNKCRYKQWFDLICLLYACVPFKLNPSAFERWSLVSFVFAPLGFASLWPSLKSGCIQKPHGHSTCGCHGNATLKGCRAAFVLWNGWEEWQNARGRPGMKDDRSGLDLFTACPVGDFGKWRQIARNKVVVHSIPRVGPFHGHSRGFHYLRRLQY